MDHVVFALSFLCTVFLFVGLLFFLRFRSTMRSFERVMLSIKDAALEISHDVDGLRSNISDINDRFHDFTPAALEERARQARRLARQRRRAREAAATEAQP